jgi:beta-1,4-mannosyltransferase
VTNADRVTEAARPRVALFPPAPAEPDAYISLLRGALTQAGATVCTVPTLGPGWVRRVDPDGLVVHLHWLEFIAPADPAPVIGPARTAWRGLRLWLALRRLRRRGAAVVWTVHNLAPHEPVHPRLQRGLSRAVLGQAQAAIVHSEHARAQVAQHLGHAEKLHVIPHGNYAGVYPVAARDREALRRSYGLDPEAYVLLSFGQLRRYKRLPALLRAFRAVPGPVQLLVAGEPKDGAEMTQIQALVEQDSRVRLQARRIPYEEVEGLHRACDAAVFAYADMFSSGSALLALSLGLPIVVPGDSTGTELASGAAVQPFADGALTEALRAIQSGAAADERRQAALTAARRYMWPEVGRQTLAAYGAAADRA